MSRNYDEAKMREKADERRFAKREKRKSGKTKNYYKVVGAGARFVYPVLALACKRPWMRVGFFRM